MPYILSAYWVSSRKDKSMTRIDRGDGIPLVPKGDPADIQVFEVVATHESGAADEGQKTTLMVRLSGRRAGLAAFYVGTGVALGYFLAKFIH
jgi:hypothetical protein